MILATYIIESDAGRSAEYKWFESLDDFAAWFTLQGDKVRFSLIKKNRSLTHDGWVKREASPLNSMTVYNTDTRTSLKVSKVVCDDGILFEDIQHCSWELVDCMALNYEIKPT